MKVKNLILSAFICLLLPVSTFAADYLTQEQKTTVGTLQSIGNSGQLFEIQYQGDYQSDKVAALQPSTAEAYQDAVRQVLLKQSSRTYTPLKSGFGCTALSAITPEGSPLLARNYDMIKDNRSIIIVHTAAKNKYASVGTADLGWLGIKKGDLLSSLAGQEALLYAPYYVMDGMNEKGFSIATLWLPGTDAKTMQELPSLFSGLVPRYMLDNARSVQDALEKFRQLNITMAFADKNCAFHWLLNDAYGDSAVVEYVNGNFFAVPKALTDKHQTVANYYLADIGKIPGENGELRTKLLEKMFRKTKYPTEQQTADWLEQVVPSKDKDLEKLGIKNIHSLWTVIYNLEKKQGTLYLAEDYLHKYTFGITQSN